MALPENTPARPAVPAAYLPVHDIPAPRSESTLDVAQQDKIAKELTAARDRQASPAEPRKARKRVDSDAN